MHKTLTVILFAFATAAAAAAPAGDALRQGQALFRAGDLDGAEEALEQAVEDAPDDAEAHHLLGATYGRQAQAGSMFTKMRLVSKIKDEFERAVALAPESLDYRESLLQFYAAAPAAVGGGVDKAKVQAAEIAKRDPVRGDLAFATVARVEGKPEEAMARLQSAYAKRPDDARLGVQLGILLQEQKRYDEAFALFQRIVARDPEALGAWYQLGRTAVLAKTRLADGEAALRKYLAGTPGPQDPPLAAAHWRLGMLYELMDKVAEARREYEAALALDPGHAESKAALKKLR